MLLESESARRGRREIKKKRSERERERDRERDRESARRRRGGGEGERLTNKQACPVALRNESTRVPDVYGVAEDGKVSKGHIEVSDCVTRLNFFASCTGITPVGHPDESVK